MKKKESAAESRQFIQIKGARVHNLKNIDVNIPKNKLVVITGVSGSGKSSLAFDTLYAEGQRRYVESLSSYARQFLGRMNKPEVDYIKGIAPAIAIEQKVSTGNPRSTVGTSTEIYDYLKLLFARIGKTYSPVSGKQVKKDTVSSILDYLADKAQDCMVQIYAPFHPLNARTLKEELAILMQKGFKRVEYNGELQKIEDIIENTKIKNVKLKDDGSLEILIDRINFDAKDEDTVNRCSDSIQTAFLEGLGDCLIEIQKEGKSEKKFFSDKFELDGIKFEEPSLHFFSFNNPFGACKTCEGFGSVIGIDENLVVPDKSKSIYDGAIACWRGEKLSAYNDKLIAASSKINLPIHRAYRDLTAEQIALIWEGNKHFTGLKSFFEILEKDNYKIQNRVLLSRYRGKTHCPDCNGSRLRKDASYVKVGDKSIIDLVLMSLDKCLLFFQNLQLNEHDEKVSKRILIELNNRLKFLIDVGLGYLTLNRLSNTLSGGESQRIKLAFSLGSSLVGSIYVLDEPSIGLHPRDTKRLIGVLESLRDSGNTVIVVEHDEEIMNAADHIIDIGPMAGMNGGHLVFDGTVEELKASDCLTGKYLSGKQVIHMPIHKRKWQDFIELKGARENNLQNVDIKIPLHVITAVTGVSGSGKTSLIKRVFVPAMQQQVNGYTTEQNGLFDSLEGDIGKIKQIEIIDQNPIGRSSRSNPVTYVKAYDEIRNLFANQTSAKALNLKPSHFSFNVDGGRCDVCNGEGEVKIEMQFMADIFLPCENCNGTRFKKEILEVKYNDKNISEVLNLTIDEAMEFFVDEKKITSRIQPLVDVGLGYVHLGQSSNTLSGGEAQRIKLASFLVKGNLAHHTLFVFDEPTTGLHFHDINKLMKSFHALIEQGNTIVIIEHNKEVIKSADWLIDLGPEGGEYGGKVIYQGLPEGLSKVKESYTGRYLNI